MRRSAPVRNLYAMTTFRVLNKKKYHTSVRLADGRRAAVRFVPSAYFGGVDESLYTTADPEIEEALKRHPSFGVTVFLKEEASSLPAEEGAEAEEGPEALLPDPAAAERVEGVTSAAKARTWLQANRDYVPSPDMTKEEIKVAAARMNVLFPDW